MDAWRKQRTRTSMAKEVSHASTRANDLSPSQQDGFRRNSRSKRTNIKDMIVRWPPKKHVQKSIDPQRRSTTYSRSLLSSLELAMVRYRGNTAEVVVLDGTSMHTVCMLYIRNLSTLHISLSGLCVCLPSVMSVWLGAGAAGCRRLGASLPYISIQFYPSRCRFGPVRSLSVVSARVVRSTS